MESVINFKIMKVLGERVVVKPTKEESKSGFIVVDKEEKPVEGIVFLVGQVKSVKKGDKVLFSKYSPIEIKVKGEDLLVVEEKDLLLTL